MKPEDRKRLKQHIEMIVEHKMPIVFCPNCEKDVECIHTAELYECKECGEDFARYIVSRQPAKSDVSMTQDVSTDIKTPQSIENTNPDYYKAAEKTALVRLCGVLGVLTENNDLATAALLAATRIERLEKKIPALNVDLAEASTHAYNGEIARMKLEAELARLTALVERLKEDAERLASGYEQVSREAVPYCVVCKKDAFSGYLGQIKHDDLCPITLHRALMNEIGG